MLFRSRDLSEALVALRQGKSYIGVDALADDLESLGVDYRFLAREIRASAKDNAKLEVVIAQALSISARLTLPAAHAMTIRVLPVKSSAPPTTIRRNRSAKRNSIRIRIAPAASLSKWLLPRRSRPWHRPARAAVKCGLPWEPMWDALAACRNT